MKNKKIVLFAIVCLLLTGCKAKTYTVTFNTEGGSNIDRITLKEGETIENISNPTKVGYLFVCWLKDGIEYDKNNPVTEDIKLSAKWIEEPTILNTYTITFVVDDKIEQTKVLENDTIAEPKIPKKENYLSLGWYVGDEKYNFNDKITKDIVLTAKYQLDVVTVTYDLDGGVGLALETIPRNTNVSIPEVPQKKGYRFLKWTLDGQDFSFTSKITKNITLKAVWEKIEYVTVTFDSVGGDPIEAKKIEKYSTLTALPIAQKEGYQFKEWQLNQQPFNIEMPIETDLILTAVYEPKQ